MYMCIYIYTSIFSRDRTKRSATPLAPTSAPCLLLLHSSLGNGMMTIYTLLIYFLLLLLKVAVSAAALHPWLQLCIYI